MSDVSAAQEHAVESVASAGDWLTGAQRIDVWRQARESRTDPLDQARRRAVTPHAVEGAHAATEFLSAEAVDVVRRTASDPGRLTRAWAQPHIDELGEETYTELIGVTAIVHVVDRFDRAMGRRERPLPGERPSAPARIRPDDVGDVGAWVSQSVGPTRANVSRTLSLVPRTNDAWRRLVDSHYSRGAEFVNLRWEVPLSRPQTELVATRTTTLSQCFY